MGLPSQPSIATPSPWAAGALLGLGAELLGAALGWPLEGRLALVLGLAHLVGGERLVTRALEPGRLRLGPPGGLALGALGAALLPLALSQLGGPAGTWALDRAPRLESCGWAAFASLVLLAPAAEELVYRGLVQRGLRARLGPGGAGLVAALGFTAAHELAGAGAGPQHLAAGLALACVAERSGGWWAPALLHGAGNAGWLLLAAS